MKQKISVLNIDISHWKKHKQCFKNKIDLCDNVRYSSKDLRIRLVKEGIIKNVCSECGIHEWNNKPISLHLDHINGNNTDNRLENLRILCPNCHSQTPTFGGRNNKRHKKIWRCLTCNVIVTANQNRCWKCYNKNKKTKIDWPPVSILIEKLKTQTMVSLAKELGVSDNAIKKHINKFKNNQG